MNEDITQRRVVKVLAGITWNAISQHRVYSCPDTPERNHVFGATCLLLKNRTDGRRVFLNVEAVETCNPHAPDFPNTVPAKFRARLNCYKDEVKDIPGILDGPCNYRFYFLSDEPWPDRLQTLTTPEHCSDVEWAAVLSVWIEAERFFQWPQASVLFWPGCTRLPGGYIYPDHLLARLTLLGLPPDLRSNGPAIIAFLTAGGKRPVWAIEGWPVHHIYDGTAPAIGGPPTVLHAVQDGRYFTHSGGLVAAHPVAHHLAHQSTLLKWVLRREAFVRFGFDPDGVFGSPA